MTITGERLEEMLAGLEGVTPGPWKAKCQQNCENGYTYTSVQPVTPVPETMSHLAMASGEYHVCRMTHTPVERKWRRYEHDAAHIARCDPDTMRELIELAKIGLQSRRAASAEPVVGKFVTKSDPFAHLEDALYAEGDALASPPASPVVSEEEGLSAEILAELTRARAKFPGKNVTFAALVEEVGELATATFEESRDRVRKEAVQVAVMAMRMVLDGDHTFDSWRAFKGLDPLTAALSALSMEEGR